MIVSVKLSKFDIHVSRGGNEFTMANMHEIRFRKGGPNNGHGLQNKKLQMKLAYILSNIDVFS